MSPPHWATWRDPVIVFAITNVALGPVVIVNSFRSQIASDFGLGLGYASSFYSIFFLVSGICGLFISSRFARLHPSKLVCIGAIGVASGASLCAQTQNLLAFVAAWVLAIAMVGATPLLSPLSSLVARRSVSGATVSLAVATLGQLTAFAFWNAVSSLLVVETWREAMMACALITAFFVPLAGLAFSPEPEMRPIKRSMPSTFESLTPCAASFFFMAACGTYAIVSFPNLQGNNSLQGPVGNLFLGFAVLGVLGRIFVAYAYDRKHTKSIPMICILSVGAASAAIPFGSSVTQHLSAMSIGAGYGGFLPVAMTRAISSTRHETHTVCSVMLACGSAGLALGSLTNGLLLQWGVMELGFLAWACALTLTIVLWLLPIASRKRLPRDQSSLLK